MQVRLLPALRLRRLSVSANGSEERDRRCGFRLVAESLGDGVTAHEIEIRVGEQRVGDHRGRIRCGISLADELAARRRHRRFEEVGRAARDRFLAAVDETPDLAIDRFRGLAVEAEAVVLDLLADGRVAITLHHVVDRLRGHDLGERRDQRRVAELRTHLDDVGLHLGKPVEGVALAQLRHGVSHRRRRQQSAQRRRVEPCREWIDDVRVVHEFLLEHERGSGHALEVEPRDRPRFPRTPRSSASAPGIDAPPASGESAQSARYAPAPAAAWQASAAMPVCAEIETATGTPAASRITWTARAAAAAPRTPSGSWRQMVG